MSASMKTNLGLQTKVLFQMNRHLGCAKDFMLLSSYQDLCRKHLYLRCVKLLKLLEAWSNPYKIMLADLHLWFLCFVKDLDGMISKVWLQSSKIVFHLECEQRLWSSLIFHMLRVLEQGHSIKQGCGHLKLLLKHLSLK
uniref:Uncharacterized protein n=1 Tax=Salix viminalis TaxID=40686 RepID=A0A6N2NK04_SALVM